MFRRIAVILAVALVLTVALVWWSRMTLSLTIGSPAVSLLQNGTIYGLGVQAPNPTGTLPVASTAGTALVAIVGTAPGSLSLTVTSAPAGWSQVITQRQSDAAAIDFWIYPYNPGGISSVTFTAPSADWWVHLSEWSNVVGFSVVEASGGTTATSGTTITPTTTTNVVTTGDLAISAWIQREAAQTTCNFTTAGGWTRLADSGSQSQTKHLDIEYQLNPTTGAPLGPTLTSDVTTTSAAAVTVVLKAAPLAADRVNYLLYSSLSVKLNTLDFALVDCPVVMQAQVPITLSSPGDYPDWVGTVSQVKAVDIVDRPTGHHLQVITATNTQLPNFTGSPYNLTDVPLANSDDIWLLENGDMYALENGSGDWLLESSTEEAGYAGLSLGSQVGSTSPVSLTTIGELTAYRVGLWAGMTFKLVSANLNSWILAPGALYTIQTITITYQGANPPTPVYQIQFGDRVQTLAEWTALH